MNIVPSPTSSRHDFDFIIGSWRVHHRKLRERLAGSNDWFEFDGTAQAFKILEDSGNMKRYWWNTDGTPFEGIALRVFDQGTRLWSIYWIDNRSLRFEVPVVGSFQDGIGTFYSVDQWQGREVTVRYVYDSTTVEVVVWKQAFSIDDGSTWETNWIMTATRGER